MKLTFLQNETYVLQIDHTKYFSTKHFCPRCTEYHSVKKLQILSQQIFFREINYSLSRNFCQKSVRDISCCLWKNKNSLPSKKFFRQIN